MTRVLLMYITMFSGHYRASLAVERAIRQLAPDTELLNLDAAQYFNPILSRLADQLYMRGMRSTPRVWDYLYDNPEVTARSQPFRRWLNRYNAPKVLELLAEFQPTVVACTQAFPCGIMADYKQRTGSTMPLYAILTDFVPHSYWLHQQVDRYFVGSTAAQAWLETSGIPGERIQRTGIPIDPVFAEPTDGAPRLRALGLDPAQPIVLVMGGGQGLGPIEQVTTALAALPESFQLVVIAGVNAKLQRRLTKLAPNFRRRVVVLGHVQFIHDLMGVATLLVTKPGGLTTSEALAKQLPMIIVDPIPGQEAKNTQLLLQHQVAIRVQRWDEVPRVVSELLQAPARLTALRQAAAVMGRPRAALEIAQVLLQRA